jgi:hypothetical protein
MATDADFTDFELIPAGADALLDEEDIPATTALEDPPIGRSWLIDFDETSPTYGQFTGDPAHGNDAVVMVAQVAMRSRRGWHPVFDDEFGLDDPEIMLGEPIDDTEKRAFHARDISETLLACHDRITSVGDFLFLTDADDEIVYVDLTIEIDGDDEVRLEGLPLYT